ncbi:hypothetical protein J6590_009241, partial [Homalodisca vitripennis]
MRAKWLLAKVIEETPYKVGHESHEEADRAGCRRPPPSTEDVPLVTLTPAPLNSTWML